jgi:hypothetical protein
MFVTTGQMKARTSFAEIAKRLEAGMIPIVQRAPGFMGYYIMKSDNSTGAGTAVFRTEQDWTAVSDEVLAWFEKNVTPLCQGDPVVISGEVITSVEADMPAQAGTGAGAEARPH